MADTYQVQVVTSSLEGSSTERTRTDIATGSILEEYWVTVKLPGAASDTVLKLNLLTDPVMLAVYGGEDISFKLDSTGVDAIGADPMAIISNTDGLNIDEILLTNAGPGEKTVTIIAYEN